LTDLVGDNRVSRYPFLAISCCQGGLRVSLI